MSTIAAAARPAQPHDTRPCGDQSPPPRMTVAQAAAWVNHAHGELRLARRALYAALTARAARPGRQPGECGTPAGYRRHERAHEPADDACADAYGWAERHRRARRRGTLRAV